MWSVDAWEENYVVILSCNGPWLTCLCQARIRLADAALVGNCCSVCSAACMYVLGSCRSCSRMHHGSMFRLAFYPWGSLHIRSMGADTHG